MPLTQSGFIAFCHIRFCQISNSKAFRICVLSGGVGCFNCHNNSIGIENGTKEDKNSIKLQFYKVITLGIDSRDHSRSTEPERNWYTSNNDDNDNNG